MTDQLRHLAAEHRDLNQQLTDPAVLGDPNALRRITQRLAELRPIVETFETWQQVTQELADTRGMLRDSKDPDMRAMVEEELATLEARAEALDEQLQELLVPADPDDEKNAVLEIRAGTGGQEAALFAGDLYRMYLRFAEDQGWDVSEAERSESDLGGLKEVIAVVEGRGAFSRLKFESGVHRVQRIPETESQGRIHTSACTVAVLPEAEDVEVDIDPGDLRIDTFRSQGAGGQHVNTTDSAVRITHLPTGIVVSCQDEKSQHKNKAKALRVLRTRIKDELEAKANAERSAQRKGMVGSGDRSERIRTYNFPQNRVTDHRINLTLHKLDQIIEGQLDELVESLAQAAAADALAEGEA